MRKFILLFTVSAFLFCGCGELFDGPEPGMIWDFANYSATFCVTDKEGNDLLNPETAGNILQNNITVSYGDKQFTLEGAKGEENPDAPQPRYNMPRPLGLRIEKTMSGQHLLTFGEFSPEGGYKNEKFVIDWGDGKKDEIKFNLYITWKKHDPTVHKQIYLNSALYSDKDMYIRLVK